MLEIITIAGLEYTNLTKYSDGTYYLSKCGKLYSTKSGKLLKISINSSGYPFVSLTHNNVTEHILLHRLLVDTFIGTIPEGMQVNHIDKNKLNYNLTNLEIISPRDNVLHAFDSKSITLVCEVCTKEFLTTDKRLISRVIRFCSDACKRSAERNKGIVYFCSREDKLDILNTYSMSSIAKQLNCSDTGLKKALAKIGLTEYSKARNKLTLPPDYF